MKRLVWIILLACIALISSFILVSASNEMVVTANFVGYGAEVISIQYPDSIYLGEVHKDYPFSDEKNIRINNTGNSRIIITPELATNASEVFNYTYFRKQKTSTTDPTLNVSHKIGEYNITIEETDYETFYIRLDLTNFSETLNSDSLNLSTQIKLTAMAY